MEKRICTKCLNEFTITDSEIDFYIKKGLHLPKKCRACRAEAKKAKSKDVSKPKRILILIAACIAMAYYLNTNYSVYAGIVPLIIGAVVLVLMFISGNKTLSHENLEAIERKYKYTFSNTDTFKEHFLKHGNETSCKSPDEYLRKANRVIANKKSVTKLEKEDNDKIYFDPDTCEIVFVSKYNKIRTYYVSDWDYFNRQ